jgi:hypothetical protein
MNKSNPFYMPQDAIGVLGYPNPGRTEYDKNMNAFFSPVKEEGFRQEGYCGGSASSVPNMSINGINLRDFKNRTMKDQAMQLAFNPLLSNIRDDPDNSYNASAVYKPM